MEKAGMIGLEIGLYRIPDELWYNNLDRVFQHQ